MSDPLAPVTPHDRSMEPVPAERTPIRTWDAHDRPRERLLQGAGEHLTDAEVLAILLGSGTRTREGPVSAVQLARTMLSTYDSLFRLSRRSVQEYTRVQGVGPAKAASIAAAFELARRVEAQRHQQERVQVSSPDDAAAVFGPRLRDLPNEVFVVVHLNTANVVLSEHTISRGGLASSIVEPRAVFRRAILEHAASIVCLHNHPSGNPEPSREDIRITRRLADAGKMMGIPLHDHLIIAGTQHTSLAERGVI